jgi:hypothetical protein
LKQEIHDIFMAKRIYPAHWQQYETLGCSDVSVDPFPCSLKSRMIDRSLSPETIAESFCCLVCVPVREISNCAAGMERFSIPTFQRKNVPSQLFHFL